MPPYSRLTPAAAAPLVRVAASQAAEGNLAQRRVTSGSDAVPAVLFPAVNQTTLRDSMAKPRPGKNSPERRVLPMDLHRR
jgi:hypothetical protein